MKKVMWFSFLLLLLVPPVELFGQSLIRSAPARTSTRFTMKGNVPGPTQDGSSTAKNKSRRDCQADYSMNAPKDVAMNEDLKITFTAPANHDPRGWIGIFLSGDDPKNRRPVSRQSVGAEHQCSGSVTLKGVATGEYDVYYFLDGDGEKVGPRSKLTAHTPV